MFNRVAQHFAQGRRPHHTDVQAVVATLDGPGHGGAMNPACSANAST
ncbi:hypothetical protein PV392_01160 [Streptomyces sp. ME03-5709C]|nr:hypothetical protein [Streptomyces sp. ME03-5709C]